MAAGTRLSLTNDRRNVRQYTQSLLTSGTIGNVTSAPTSVNTTFSVPVASGANGGTIVGAILSCTMGVDASNPLSISVQVTNTRTGNTVFSTVPSLAKAAGNVFCSTANGASTGVVPAVLQNTAVKNGDVLKAVWTLTRTATPGTEIADAAFQLLVAENQDFDPASA